MNKLFRGTIFLLAFGVCMAALSMLLYKINIPWLSPDFLDTTFFVILAYGLSKVPGIEKFLQGTA